MQRRLAIFTRYPEPGKTKTRLIPALGPAGAAEVQRDMTRHTLARVQEFAAGHRPTNRPRDAWCPLVPVGRAVSVEVRFEGGDAERMAACFGRRVSYRPHGQGDLGCRMDRAFAEAFLEGAEQIVLIGTDSPGITPELIRESFDRLAACDAYHQQAVDIRSRVLQMPYGDQGLFVRKKTFQELGAWRTTWINQKVILGYYLGVSLERLAAWHARRAK